MNRPNKEKVPKGKKESVDGLFLIKCSRGSEDPTASQALSNRLQQEFGTNAGRN